MGGEINARIGNQLSCPLSADEQYYGPWDHEKYNEAREVNSEGAKMHPQSRVDFFFFLTQKALDL
jgi:hypothetical protein